MTKMTLEDLRKLRGEKKTELDKRNATGRTATVIVGMGTCGIASGAKQTLDAFAQELERLGAAATTSLRQTGCMGMCSREPTVEVQVPGMGRTLYGNVKESTVTRIVESHILHKTALPELIIAKWEDA